MIKVVCVGKVKEKYLQEAICDYVKRISKYHKINIIEVEDSNMIEEKVKILKHIDNKDYVVTLDIEGKQLTSVEFADKIDKTFITNSSICFVIGGSYGLDKEVKIRVILLEQIYRNFKILNNETYHK